MTDIERVKEDVESVLIDRGLNLLINNSGINYRMSLDNVTADKLNTVFQTNVTGPIMVTKTFLPLLKKAASQHEDKSLSTSRAAVINISSILGSIEENSSGGLHGYRPSKAALNMFTKSLSVELREHGILAAALHPGWVRTDMGGPRATLGEEESIRGCLNVMAGLTEEKSGKMIAFDGRVIPW
ncbi:hypothetical protein FSP39_011115 [Pinctada imbricata]|uniref:C-factor n=1 Tax=Pinctada imbricata TaxID=66713 RepID=A0AA88XGV6_PINIB|nr:hypothetical protein FSP39_011115 [Pinctada imbricata]